MEFTQAIQLVLVIVGLGLFFVPGQMPRSRRAALSLILFSASGLVPMVLAKRAPTDPEQFAIGAIILLAVALAMGLFRTSKK
jgi:hypothetical protein